MTNDEVKKSLKELDDYKTKFKEVESDLRRKLKSHNITEKELKMYNRELNILIELYKKALDKLDKK